MNDGWWTDEERRSLILSIGGGRQARPLAPMEVARLLQSALAAGASMRDIATVLHLDSTTMIGRFLSLQRLPPQVQSRVGWGRSNDSLNLTQSQEIARLSSEADMVMVAGAAVEHRLTSAELRSVVQLVNNSGDTAARALEKILALRPQLERRFVTIGQVKIATARRALERMSRDGRAALLRDCLQFEVQSATLAPTHFTVVTLQALGQTADELEELVNAKLGAELGLQQ